LRTLLSGKVAALIAVAAAFGALPLFDPPAFVESFFYLAFFWIALATSWSVFSGFSGYLSFGHGAFFGVGMYTTAVLVAGDDVPFLWTLPFAGLIAALLALAIGAVVFRIRRLRGELFALLTLAVTFIVATIVLNTRIDGGQGIFLSGVSFPKVYRSSAATIYFFAVVIAFGSLAVTWAIQYSAFGKALFAISDDEDVAEVMGIPTYRFKLVAFAISASLAGVVGGIHAVFVTYVTVADTFSITVPLFVVLMAILGGARHWLGPAIGASLITALTYAFVGGELALAGRAITGLILIAVILYLPHGIMSLFQQRTNSSVARQRAPEPSRTVRVIAQRPTSRPGVAEDVLLRCEDVQLSFRGVRALDGVNLDVRRGEILGLVGPNGSGKSTLVNVISGYYRPDEGRALFEGNDLCKIEAYRIARAGVARTYQIPRPLQHFSVLENVTLAAMFGASGLGKEDARRDAAYWLDFVGLRDRSSALPRQLNLHQRKFLELARALAPRPKLVLLDEVLAGLTAAEIEHAIALVREIREQGTTVLFIEHNMRVVLELTERLFVLNYGKVITHGLPRDVMREPDVVAAYLGKAHA
jgi:branched-chain amino acid transport system permease protein